MEALNVTQPRAHQHPVVSGAELEIIRETRRELANRYGSRGTTDQLRTAIEVLEATFQG